MFSTFLYSTDFPIVVHVSTFLTSIYIEIRLPSNIIITIYMHKYFSCMYYMYIIVKLSILLFEYVKNSTILHDLVA